jgi:hypothetical protein
METPQNLVNHGVYVGRDHHHCMYVLKIKYFNNFDLFILDLLFYNLRFPVEKCYVDVRESWFNLTFAIEGLKVPSHQIRFA